MPNGSISQVSLFDALTLMEFTLASGTVRVVGGKSGDIDLGHGRISFATIEGRYPDEKLAEAGIDGLLWTRLTGARGLRSSLLEQAGHQPGLEMKLAAFLEDWVVATIAELAMVEGAIFENVAAVPHPSSLILSFPVSDIVEQARLRSIGGAMLHREMIDALVSINPTKQTVELPCVHWNVFAELLPPFELQWIVKRVGAKRAIDFVRFLREHDLAKPIARGVAGARVAAGGMIPDDKKALLAFTPCDGDQVEITAGHWNVLSELMAPIHLSAISDRLGPERASEFARFLQTRALATAMEREGPPSRSPV